MQESIQPAPGSPDSGVGGRDRRSLRRVVAQMGIGLLAIAGASVGMVPIALAQTAADYRLEGLAYRQQGQYDAAIAAFQSAVALDPQNMDGQVLLGWTQHLAQQRPMAIATLQTAIYQHPFSPQPFNALGIVYLVEGQLTDAVLSHSWAALLNPNNEIAYYNLSLAYHRLGYYDWAIATAEKATRLEPENPHPRIALALAQWDKGDRTTAQATYQQALSLDGRYGDAEFLQYLAEAAFHPEQIRLSRTILESLD